MLFFKLLSQIQYSGADPGFFLGGGALVSCSTSTPINHIGFFSQNTSCIRKPKVISGGGYLISGQIFYDCSVLILISFTWISAMMQNFKSATWRR